MPHSLRHRERSALFACTLLACLAPQLAPPAGAGPWTDISPGGGGAFTTIGAGPTGVLICGADLSGAYRSLDHGLTWDRIGFDKGIRRSHVSTVGFDPVNPQIIHIGTDVGLYRSVDGAASFTRVIERGYISAVTPAWTDTSVVYAGYQPSFDSTATTVYRSVDRGVTYAPVSVTFPAGIRILKLAVSPQDANTLYIVSGEDLFVAGLPVLYRSTDGGANWTQIGDTLGNVWDMALDPVTQGTLYATSYVGTPGDVWSGNTWKSIDNGDTWTQVSAHTGAIVVKRDQPQVVRVIDGRRNTIEPESGTWETLDGGTTWTRKSTMFGWGSGWQSISMAYGGGPYGNPCMLGQDLSAPDAIYWVSWQFAFGSQDGGLTFQNLTTNQVSPGFWRTRGIDNIDICSISISPAAPSQIYAGFHDCGFWRSLDGGQSWQSGNAAAFTDTWAGQGGNSTTVLADPDRPGVVWASMSGHKDSLRLVRSTLGGTAASWVLASGVPFKYVRGLSLDRSGPVNPRTLFVTVDGDVYRSVDDGLSWTSVFNCDSCRATAVDRFDGNFVYAGGEGGLWRSQAHGDPGTWTRIGPPEMSGTNSRDFGDERWEGVHQIVADPSHPGRAYVVAHGTGRGLYRSTDRGTTWTRILASTYMRDVAVDPVDSRILLTASSRQFSSSTTITGSDGIQRSTDGGVKWTALNDGLPYPFAVRVAFDPSNHSRLILGTSGNGLFERFMTGATVGVEPGGVPGRIALSDAFPNPSRGELRFTLDLPREALVRWSVIDLQGRRVWGESRICPTGTAAFTWDPTRTPGGPGDGVYFARFEVNGEVFTRRFAILR